MISARKVKNNKLNILIIPTIALLLGFAISAAVLALIHYYNKKLSLVAITSSTEVVTNDNNKTIPASNTTQIDNTNNNSHSNAVVSEFGVEEKGKVIVANLDEMQITLIEDGVTKSTLPILTKGKPGSYYETPGGDYKIESKEDVKLSTLGNVYMPYAMQFFGNYFIHGIPYYKDGKKVSTSYSGGCIRLSDENAKIVYDFASTQSTKVHITNNSYYSVAGSEPEYYIAESEGLGMTASQAIVMDLISGDVLLEYNGNQIIPMEGNAKMLAANVSLDVVNQEKVISYNNNKIQIKDLLAPLLSSSDESALDIIVKQYGYSNFVKKMNSKAAAIKLNNTTIVEPSGLSEKTLSTVYDIAKLIKYTNDFKPFLLTISSSTSSTSTLNIYAGRSGYYGGSFGFLPTQYHSLAGIFDISVNTNLVDVINGNTQNNITEESRKKKVVIVISGSINPEGDINNLLSYLNNNATAR